MEEMKREEANIEREVAGRWTVVNEGQRHTRRDPTHGQSTILL